MCDYKEYLCKAMGEKGMSQDEADETWDRDIENPQIVKDLKGPNGTRRVAWQNEEPCEKHDYKCWRDIE